jgi:hypothetical protein
MKCKDRCKESECTFCALNGKDTVRIHGDCEGDITYDDGVEGEVCSKCHYYNGIK